MCVYLNKIAHILVMIFFINGLELIEMNNFNQNLKCLIKWCVEVYPFIVYINIIVCIIIKQQITE